MLVLYISTVKILDHAPDARHDNPLFQEAFASKGMVRRYIFFYSRGCFVFRDSLLNPTLSIYSGRTPSKFPTLSAVCSPPIVIRTLSPPAGLGWRIAS